MKLIKPIVSISKIIEGYDAVISGYNGVLSKGNGIHFDAMTALQKCAEKGKKVAVLSNSPKRVRELIEEMNASGLNLSFLETVITAGEVAHYCLKNMKELQLPGKKYYNMGAVETAAAIFDGLDYQRVAHISEADFVFVADLRSEKDSVEDYTTEMEHACSLGLPMLCVGNDVSTYKKGEICIGSAALAEQYAVLGGQIMTIGKPEQKILSYITECFGENVQKILLIGDNFATDIKSGEVLGADTLLISKGVHVHSLGEGYIPDVEKARNLALHFNVFPDYVGSGLRW